MPEVLLDAAGRPRSPATLPGFHAGRSPRNKGQRCPADPPTVAEIVAVMRHADTGLHAARLRALIVVLWRAGLRIHEALALSEASRVRDPSSASTECLIERHCSLPAIPSHIRCPGTRRTLGRRQLRPVSSSATRLLDEAVRIA
jgi:hypothetical protein